MGNYSDEKFPDESYNKKSELERLREENILLREALERQNVIPESLFIPSDKNTGRDYSRGERESIRFIPSDIVLSWIKDIHGNFLWVSGAMALFMDYPAEGFLGKTDYDFYPKSSADKSRTEMEKVFQTGHPSWKNEIKNLNNKFRWFETLRIPLFNEGKIIGLIAYSRDITNIKKGERTLMEREENFRELAENTTDAFVLRTGRKIIYVNPAFEQVYGYTRKNLKDDPDLYKKWIHPEDRERILRVLDSHEYRATYIFNEQYRVIKKDGSVNWIWNRSFPVCNERGEMYRIVSFASNITEIKKLEEDLYKSRFTLQAILDNIPHLAWLKATDGKYISVNKPFAQFHNKSPEFFVGKSDFDFCKKELAEDYHIKDLKVLRSKEPKQFCESEELEKGIRYSETFKAPVINKNGEVIGTTGISRDITAQKKAEEALIRSEEKYKTLVTLLPEIVFETDINGKLTFLNLKASELMGYSQEDIKKGLTFFDLVSKEDKDRFYEIFKSFSYGSELKGKEFGVVSKAGNNISVFIYTNNIYIEQKWSGIRGVMIDISRKKEAEEQERIYQSKLMHLSDTALDFLGMDLDVNLYRFIGQRLSEILSDVVVIINSYDDHRKELKLEYHSFSPRDTAFMSRTLRKKSDDFSFEINENELKHLFSNSEHLYEFKGGFHESTFGGIPKVLSDSLAEKLQLKGFFGMALMRDQNLYGSVLLLSAQPRLKDKHFIETFIYQASIALHKRQLEQELMEAKKIAEESANLKTAFLANMSHEIRTPLNGILGLADILSREKVEHDKYYDYLDMIGSNGKLLLNLVNDIIDISKIEARQIDILKSVFSLENLLQEVYRVISAEKMAKGIDTVEIILDPEYLDIKSHIKADKSKIEQVLINLLGNALKFTQKGEIRFGCKAEKNQNILFWVQDTGVGIPGDKMEVIFDRFTQADHSLSRSFSGSGLGLAISKGFVEIMGGEIYARSEVGVGSVFYFTVPVENIQEIPSKKVKRTKNISDYNFNGITILIVEDNLVSYKLLEIALSKTGCIIQHADNGEKAIQMVKNKPEIDIVLMDIQLPVLNGYLATQLIKQIRPEIPVIAQTANAMDSDRERCLQVGCEDYVTKPIVIEELLPIIEDNVKKK